MARVLVRDPYSKAVVEVESDSVAAKKWEPVKTEQEPRRAPAKK